MDDERSMVVLGAVVGAALGALAGYLFLTERGRQLREDIEPQIGAFLNGLADLQATVDRAGVAVADGLRSVSAAADGPRA